MEGEWGKGQREMVLMVECFRITHDPVTYIFSACLVLKPLFTRTHGCSVVRLNNQHSDSSTAFYKPGSYWGCSEVKDFFETVKHCAQT